MSDWALLRLAYRQIFTSIKSEEIERANNGEYNSHIVLFWSNLKPNVNNKTPTSKKEGMN